MKLESRLKYQGTTKHRDWAMLPSPRLKGHHLESASSLAEERWFANLAEIVDWNQGWERKDRNLVTRNFGRESGIAVGIS